MIGTLAAGVLAANQVSHKQSCRRKGRRQMQNQTQGS